jgi:hypothetical protein
MACDLRLGLGLGLGLGLVTGQGALAVEVPGSHKGP